MKDEQHSRCSAPDAARPSGDRVARIRQSGHDRLRRAPAAHPATRSSAAPASRLPLIRMAPTAFVNGRLSLERHDNRPRPEGPKPGSKSGGLPSRWRHHPSTDRGRAMKQASAGLESGAVQLALAGGLRRPVQREQSQRRGRSLHRGLRRTLAGASDGAVQGRESGVTSRQRLWR